MSALKTPRGRLLPGGLQKIHELRNAGRTYQEIAAAMGVCITTVYNVLKGKTHKGEIDGK